MFRRIYPFRLVGSILYLTMFIGNSTSYAQGRKINEFDQVELAFQRSHAGQLYCGTKYLPYLNKVYQNRNPYFKEIMYPGKLWYNSNFYDSLYLSIDLVKSLLLVRNKYVPDAWDQMLEFSPEQVDSFYLDHHMFVSLKLPEQSKAFYTRLYCGHNLNLWARYGKEYRHHEHLQEINEVWNTIKDNTSYFLESSGVFNLVKRRNDLPGLLNISEISFKKFVDSNEVNYDINPEHFLLSVIINFNL